MKGGMYVVLRRALGALVIELKVILQCYPINYCCYVDQSKILFMDFYFIHLKFLIRFH